jgi:hypothetical protein
MQQQEPRSMSMHARGCRALAGLAILVALAAPAAAQEARDPASFLEDFVHYTLIARPDLAAENARALIESGITDAELAELVDDSERSRQRFQQALARAQRVPELEDIAADLDRRLHDGRLDLARQPARIEEAIGWLVGNQRQRMLAGDLLAEAGEYAVPSLLRAITDGQDDRLREAAGRMLVQIGRQAVTPLCVALLSIDPDSQRFVCRILGEIGLAHAGPALLELSSDDSVPETTREAAARAFRRVGGVDGGVSAAYARLARQYFNESESLIAFPLEPTSNVWSFDPFAGLTPTPVPTEIFSEVMAMRTAARALRLDSSDGEALAVFVASNLRRANELPGGADDPIYGESRYSPEFYATVFGTQVCMHVLAMALDRLDTPLARDAIQALAWTTGGASLFAAASDRQPLLESLQYPDRRVQYEAALTLARALPDRRFAGDVRIVPLLASAVRAGDETYALVLASDQEDRRVRSAWLEELGFTVVAAGDRLEATKAQVEESVGVDLVVVEASSIEQATEAVGELRVYPRTSATPVLLVAVDLDMSRLKNEFRDDVRVKVSRARAAQEAFAESVDEVMERAAGGRMTEAQAEVYAIDAIMALRDIAIAGTTAYVVSDAEASLLLALVTRSGAIRLAVADILALIDGERAQGALFDAALAAEGDEQVELLNRVSESVKRFGNRAQRRHVDALLALITGTSGATADAAARVHGALTLPPQTAIDLIPD